MYKIWNKYPVLSGISCGYGISVLFILIEYVLSGLSDTKGWVWIDSSLRLILGMACLLVLKHIYGDNFPRLFKSKITKPAIACITPVILYFIVEFSYLLSAKQIITSTLFSFFIMWIAQAATGMFEEAASRGILMSGMLQKWNGTVKGRIGSIFITGLLFSSLHILSFIYGTGITECLRNGLFTFTWGMLIAAIYMLSENLLLVMSIHTIWNIIARIPRYFTDNLYNGILLNITQVTENILSLVIFPSVAVLSCIFAYRNRQQQPGQAATASQS